MRPLILISNDDGYQAKGINELVRMVSDYGDVLVCAPDGARSGMSCAFSATIPLTLTLIRKEPGLEVWSCNGTPVDCVKMALANLCARKPDLVIGGINHGDNASVNTHYSGTMGVTMEGCMKYIPSVAFSLCDHSDDADFERLLLHGGPFPPPAAEFGPDSTIPTSAKSKPERGRSLGLVRGADCARITAR